MISSTCLIAATIAIGLQSEPATLATQYRWLQGKWELVAVFRNGQREPANDPDAGFQVVKQTFKWNDNPTVKSCYLHADEDCLFLGIRPLGGGCSWDGGRCCHVFDDVVFMSMWAFTMAMQSRGPSPLTFGYTPIFEFRKVR